MLRRPAARSGSRGFTLLELLPYLQKAVPDDPWGNPYVFVMPGEHGEYDLLSYGRDGMPGGEGQAGDIASW